MSELGIGYYGGSYGTYLHWALFTMTNNIPVESPLTQAGSSHFFTKSVYPGGQQQTKNLSVVSRNLNQAPGLNKFNDTLPKIYRFHPAYPFVDEFRYLQNLTHRFVIIVPEPDCYLLTINNVYHKSFNDNIFDAIRDWINLKDLFLNFPVDPSTELESVPRDILREFLSFQGFDLLDFYLEFFNAEFLYKNNCIVVGVKDILFNFSSTIERILDSAELTAVRSSAELLDIHNENLRRQQFLTQDSLAHQIIESTLNNVEFCWDNKDLTLFTEAYIQRSFRNRGLDLRSYNLSRFPTSTHELSNLLETPRHDKNV